MTRKIERQAPNPSAQMPAGDVMPRRKALKRIGGGAVAGALLLTGCTPPGAPTPVATARPSPPWTPGPTGASDGGPLHATSIQQQAGPNR